MVMDVRMCECIVCMKEKANKVKKSGIRPPNLFLKYYTYQQKHHGQCPCTLKKNIS
jgi:hypothetical protein